MTGSKFCLFAWLLPLLIAGVFAARIHTLRANNKDLARSPRAPATEVPTSTPAVPSTHAASVASEAQTVARLRHELTQLRARIAYREQQLSSATPMPKPEPLSLTEDFLSAEAWRDAGTATPAALAETVLWAGAGGDVQRMASLLTYDEDALAAANALCDRLPAELRPPGVDGRALIALLSTDAVPLSTAKLLDDFPLESGEHVLVIRLTPAKDAPPGTRSRNVKLTARRKPNSASWNVVVPTSAVDRLASSLGLNPSP
jgi:hypothetical protein